jgi:preprotein translocase subunit YajC
MIIWLLPVMLIVMILMSSMAGRKEKKKRAELIGALKKHDRVQTLGGIVGTVAEVGETEVVLRVEEGRIRFNKTAIQAIVDPSKVRSDTSIAELKGEAKATV